MVVYIMLLCLWSDLNYICSGQNILQGRFQTEPPLQTGIIGATGTTTAPTNRFVGAADNTSRLYKSIYKGAPYKYMIYREGMIGTTGRAAFTKPYQPLPETIHVVAKNHPKYVCSLWTSDIAERFLYYTQLITCFIAQEAQSISKITQYFILKNMEFYFFLNIGRNKEGHLPEFLIIHS